MLQNLKRLFQSFNDPISENEVPDFKTAVAALLVEVMRADSELQPQEQEMILSLLQKHFALSVEEANTLVAEASSSLDEAIDYYRFSKQINDNTSAEQRIEILELLWQLAYADGKLDRYEEHVIRKVADLLYVTHNDFIRAKLAAQPK